MSRQNGYLQEQRISSWNTTPNKEALIRVISDKLCQNGYKVVQASGDADVDIVEAAVSSHLTKSTTLMERKHILWCFSFSTHKLFKIGSSSGLTNQKTTFYRVTVLKSVLGSDISKQLTHICACLHIGCDTTSRVYTRYGKESYDP